MRKGSHATGCPSTSKFGAFAIISSPRQTMDVGITPFAKRYVRSKTANEPLPASFTGVHGGGTESSRPTRHLRNDMSGTSSEVFDSTFAEGTRATRSYVSPSQSASPNGNRTAESGVAKTTSAEQTTLPVFLLTSESLAGIFACSDRSAAHRSRLTSSVLSAGKHRYVRRGGFCSAAAGASIFASGRMTR